MRREKSYREGGGGNLEVLLSGWGTLKGAEKRSISRKFDNHQEAAFKQVVFCGADGMNGGFKKEVVEQTQGVQPVHASVVKKGERGKF